jgi:hypothetical protein
MKDLSFAAGGEVVQDGIGGAVLAKGPAFGAAQTVA